MSHSLSRRDVLRMCTAFGALTLSTPISTNAAIDLIQTAESGTFCPTPTTVLGPFYKKLAPKTSVLRMADDPGLPLSVRGRVSDARGNTLDGAVIEVWHANHLGRYDIEGYRFRAMLIAGKAGEYAFESVMPGHYPDRVAQHLHYLVSAPGHKPLVTQLYFAIDQVFEGNPAKNFHRDPLIPSVDVVRPVVLTGDHQTVSASVVFDLCLEQL
jgi:protocatechuate 3,4-dioxygenase beta subunit